MRSSHLDANKGGNPVMPYLSKRSMSLGTYGTFESSRAHETSETTTRNNRWNSRTIAISLFSLGGFLALLVWIYGYIHIDWHFMLCGTIFSSRGAPKDWNDFKNQSFAVGFDLTAGYGTAAIAFNNGTTIDIARAEGTTNYNDVLARLSLKSSAHPTPPYYNCNTQASDLGRQWRRYFRRRLGYPASSDIAALASILSDLKIQSNSFLRDSGLDELEMAFITCPYLPALYLEDLADAAEHVGVQMLTLPGTIYRCPGAEGPLPVTELNTAFAGMGQGIDFLLSASASSDITSSSSSEDGNKSKREDTKTGNEGGRWSDNVLSVLFTNTALTAHVLPLHSAQHFFWADGIANFSLGLPSSQPHSKPPPPFQFQDATDDYWLQIRLSLRAAMNSYFYHGHELGTVVVYGENAHHKIFNKVLEEEVREAQSHKSEPEKWPKFLSRHPVFAAARGAAVFGTLCPKLPGYLSCFVDLRPRMQGW